MTMKKIITGLLAVTMLCGTLAGCGEKKESAASGKTKISIAAWPSTEGAELEAANEKKKNFEAENSNIEIIPDTWTFDLETFYPKAEAGMLPTMFVVAMTEMSKLIDGEYVGDVTDSLKNIGWYDNLNPQLMELFSADGRTYGYPKEAYCVGLAFNAEMFKAAGLVEEDGTPKQPKDWNEMAEFAVKIKEATGKPGIALTTANNTGGWLFMNIAWSYGVNFMERGEDGKWKATFNSPEMVEAIQFVKDLKWKYDVLPSKVIIDNDEQAKLFAMGDAGMIIAPSDTNLAGRLSKYEMSPETVGMLPLPAGPKAHVTLLGGAVRCVPGNATEDEKDAVFKWLKFGGDGYTVGDAEKKRLEEDMKVKAENGNIIGIGTLSVWNENAEKAAFEKELREKYANVNMKNVQIFNDSLESGEIELRAEEPVCAQDLYGLIDNILQEVLNNEDADCAQLVEKANEDFQVNFLNNITY